MVDLCSEITMKMTEIGVLEAVVMIHRETRWHRRFSVLQVITPN